MNIGTILHAGGIFTTLRHALGSIPEADSHHSDVELGNLWGFSAGKCVKPKQERDQKSNSKQN